MEATRGFYRRVAAQTGFEPAFVEDITVHVQPTHGVLAALVSRLASDIAAEVRDIDVAMKLKLCTYNVMVFRRL
jgi:hypothetical protein